MKPHTPSASPGVELAVYAVAAWLAAILYFRRDQAALVLAICLPPIGVLFLAAAWSLRQRTLLIFMLLLFAAHVIAPPFFFVSRDLYAETGWGAVGTFDFSLGSFFRAYVPLLLFVTMLTGAVALLARLFRRSQPNANAEVAPPRMRVRRRSNRFDVALLILVCVGVLLNLWMFRNAVAVVGITPPVLPLHLAGGLYYFRFFAIPVLLMVLYARSSRGGLAFGSVAAYAVVAGLCALSRSIMLISMGGVLFFTMADRQRLRLLFLGLIVLLNANLISSFRNVVYVQPRGTLRLGLILETDTEHVWNVGESVGTIANRLYGPQDIILAGQHAVRRPIADDLRFLRGEQVVTDLAESVYGLVFDPGVSMGIGMGYAGMVILMSGVHLGALAFFAMATALLLVVAETQINRLRSTLFGRNVSIAMAFLMAFALYASQLRLFYEILAATFLLASVLKIAHAYGKGARRLRRASPTVQPNAV